MTVKAKATPLVGYKKTTQRNTIIHINSQNTMYR